MKWHIDVALIIVVLFQRPSYSCVELRELHWRRIWT